MKKILINILTVIFTPFIFILEVLENIWFNLFIKKRKKYKMIEFLKSLGWWGVIGFGFSVFIVLSCHNDGNYRALFWFVSFDVATFFYRYIIFVKDKDFKSLSESLEKIKEKTDFEHACGFDKLHKESLEKDKKITKLSEKDLKNNIKIDQLELLLCQYSSSNTIRILKENPKFLKMCDDLLEEGEKTHPNSQWETISFEEHFKKAKGHLLKEMKGLSSDHCQPHGFSAVCRTIFGLINKYTKKK